MAASDLRSAQVSRTQLSGFPVLLYHGLVEAMARTEDRYVVAVDRFRAQLKLASMLGLRTLSLREAWQGRAEGMKGSGSVVVTFDDGRLSDYRLAFPELQRAGVPAEFFVNTRLVGSAGFLGWAEIREMAENGMSFQSHGHDHAALTRLPTARLREQLAVSKRLLEDRLGREVAFLGAPYGFSSARVVATAREAGYRAVCTSLEWPARPGATSLGRVAIDRDTSDSALSEILERRVRPYLRRAVRTAFLHLPKRFLLRFWPAKLGVHVLPPSSCPRAPE